MITKMHNGISGISVIIRPIGISILAYLASRYIFLADHFLQVIFVRYFLTFTFFEHFAKKYSPNNPTIQLSNKTTSPLFA